MNVPVAAFVLVSCVIALGACAPKPGDPGYDATACGGDHGMAQEWFDDRNGYPRIGPPEMSICR